MYGLLAVAALALAGLSEGTRVGLKSIVDKNDVAREVMANGMKSIKVEGDTVKLAKREGWHHVQ